MGFETGKLLGGQESNGACKEEAGGTEDNYCAPNQNKFRFT